MSHIFGCYGPFGSLKNPFFHGLIAQYFLTFFIGHPVCMILKLLFIDRLYPTCFCTVEEGNHLYCKTQCKLKLAFLSTKVYFYWSTSSVYANRKNHILNFIGQTQDMVCLKISVKCCESRFV